MSSSKSQNQSSSYHIYQVIFNHTLKIFCTSKNVPLHFWYNMHLIIHFFDEIFAPSELDI